MSFLIFPVIFLCCFASVKFHTVLGGLTCSQSRRRGPDITCQARGSCRADITFRDKEVKCSDSSPPISTVESKNKCQDAAEVRRAIVRVSERNIVEVQEGSFVVCATDMCNDNPFAFVGVLTTVHTVRPEVGKVRCYCPTDPDSCSECHFCTRNSSVVPELDLYSCVKDPGNLDYDWKLDIVDWSFLLVCRNDHHCNAKKIWPDGFPDRIITTTMITLSSTNAVSSEPITEIDTTTTTPTTTETTSVTTAVPEKSSSSSSLIPESTSAVKTTLRTPVETTIPTTTERNKTTVASEKPGTYTSTNGEGRPKGLIEVIVVGSFISCLIIAFIIIFLIVNIRRKSKMKMELESAEVTKSGSKNKEAGAEETNEGATAEKAQGEQQDSAKPVEATKEGRQRDS